MTNRVHIDAPAGIIDIEGEKDFVEGLLSRLFPLIEVAGFGSRSPAKSDHAEPVDDTQPLKELEHPDEAVKSKIKRRRGSAPPKGQSCGDRIMSLKADGFFVEHRAGADIVAGLRTKGWTHNSSQVAAAAGDLFNRGTLQRTKEANGPFKYYWDRG